MIEEQARKIKKALEELRKEEIKTFELTEKSLKDFD